ncbi:hypothetical protein E3P77_01859 [Wallemia ichthyophaga]|nr:hypothetical protein E3P77_01859 [Wallemia ichthyophaga]
MLPGFDLNSQVGPPINRDSFESGCESDTSRWNKNRIQLPALKLENTNLNSLPSPSSSSSSDHLEERMQQISISAQCKDNTRYIGKSSSVYLMAALDEYSHNNYDIMDTDRRPEFWKDREWSIEEENDPAPLPYSPDELPPDDLLLHLTNIFFDRLNVYFPVLHKSSFLYNLQNNTHDPKFGAIVFLLCAAASRYSNDPRVVPDDDKDEQGNVKNWRFAGNSFFIKFKTHCRRFLLTAATLQDLQLIILMIVYLQGGPFSPACWAISSIGLVLAQDIGFHRKRPQGDGLHDELRKRAFWCLYILDKQLSAMLGRPSTLHDEDIDVDEPSVLPDEMDTSMQLSVLHFNKLIALVAILGEVLRTVYVVNKRRRPGSGGAGGGGLSEAQRTLMDVAALDSKLHKWLDDMPPELSWDASCTDSLTFNYMCILQTTYYVVQIYIHRPFIATPRRPSPLSYPSLAICTNAARSCIHVLDHLQTRSNDVLYMDSWIGMGSFTSSVILIVSACEGRRNGETHSNINSNTNPHRHTPEMKDIDMGIAVVRKLEDRHLHAGRAHDVLRKLRSRIDSIPVNAGDAKDAGRGDCSASVSPSTTTSTGTGEGDGKQRRKIAKKPSHFVQGARGGQGNTINHANHPSPNYHNLASLPICTNDLANHNFYPTPTPPTASPACGGFEFDPIQLEAYSEAQTKAQVQLQIQPQPQPQPQLQPQLQTQSQPHPHSLAGLQSEYNMLEMDRIPPYTNTPTYDGYSAYPHYLLDDMFPAPQREQDLWSMLPNSTYNPNSEDWATFFKYT